MGTLLEGANPQSIATGIQYASRNQVTSLEITQNKVISTVRGPNGGNHKNYIVFPNFSKDRIEIFAGLLKQQPAELLAISNGALSPSIELLLNKSGLVLFDSFSSINAGCDCRDEQPCKYIIATFAKIASLAKSDPNILFKLHGLDLDNFKDMEANSFEVDVPSERLLVRGLDKADFCEPLDHEGEEESRIPPPQLPQLDFKSWKDYTHILPAMLKNFPRVTAGGNFRKSFVDEQNACRNFILSFKDFESLSQQLQANYGKTFLMENESLKVYHHDKWRWHFDQIHDDKVIQSNLTAANIIGALCCISSGNFSWHHYTVRYLHLLLQVAYHLLRTGAIYPQVFWIANDVAKTRWLPAEMLPDVLNTVTTLEAAAPGNFSFTAKEEEFRELADPAEQIISLFIGELIRYARKYKEKTLITAYNKSHVSLLSFLFDCPSGKLVDNFHDLPAQIQQWFSVYSSLDFRTPIVFACAESGDDIALEVFVQEGDVRTPLSKLFEINDPRLLSILNVLSGIADTLPAMNGYLDRRAISPIMLRGADLLEFLQESIKKLEILGIQAELPKSLLKIGKPKAQMRLQGSISFGGFSANDILDFDWEVAIGDEHVSAKEFLKLAEEADGLLKYKSQYVQITKEDIQDIRERLAKKESGEASEKISQAQLLRACLTEECNNVAVTFSPELKEKIREWNKETNFSLPENLNATLRPYQERGYSWMYKIIKSGFGCILADDMGLGKTLQVITLLLKIKQEGFLESGKALVVMPAGLLCNWQMEIKKFAPELKTFSYHGSSRSLEKFAAAGAHVLLTTYGTFRKDFTKLKECPWQAIVIDEAQNIKNADSDQSRMIRAMEAPMRIAMSGTPVENRLMEFWTIMDFSARGILSGATEFREKFETPIQKNGDKKAAETFRKLTAPFMLRRLKTDKSIISDLPDKIIQDEYAELTKSQAALYKKTLERFLAQISEEQLLSEMSRDSHALFKRKGLILQMILALKQICNHPATFLKSVEHFETRDPRMRGDDIVGRGDDIVGRGDDPRHSGRGDSGAGNDTQHNAEQPEVAETADKRKLDSGKMEMLLDLLSSIQEQGEKTLIFTQFAEMGELLKSTIESQLGLKTAFYHGGCTQTQRKTMIQDFQENPETKVLILSLKAGGTGLNLTAASQVIHYDLWWNPAIEAQATDRAFRIGQTRNVQVHRFITKGTFEEKINSLLESKKAIAQMTVNTGETWLADMSDKELDEIFRLDSTLI